MSPPIPVVATDWLADPLARRVGPKTVAMILILASRAAALQARDVTVAVAADVWATYLDGVETERAVVGGLVAPLLVGERVVAYRVADWILARVDTMKALRVRELTRERVRRLRARRRDQTQLALWQTPADLARPDPTRPVDGLCKTPDPSQDRSARYSVTGNAGDAGPSLDRARAVRTSMYSLIADRPVPDRSDQPDRPKRPQSAPVENAAEKAKTFRLILAVVAHIRQTRPEWIAPTGSTDRRDLLDAVRDALTRAGVTTATDAQVRRAIRYVAEDAALERVVAARAGRSS